MQTDTIEAPTRTRVSAAARLDRLPIGRFHKELTCLLAYVFFFEVGDLNNFGLAAPELRIQWKLSIAAAGLVTSAAFLGDPGWGTGRESTHGTNDQTLGRSALQKHANKPSLHSRPIWSSVMR